MLKIKLTGSETKVTYTEVKQVGSQMLVEAVETTQYGFFSNGVTGHWYEVARQNQDGDFVGYLVTDDLAVAEHHFDLGVMGDDSFCGF